MERFRAWCEFVSDVGRAILALFAVLALARNRRKEKRGKRSNDGVKGDPNNVED